MQLAHWLVSVLLVFLHRSLLPIFLNVETDKTVGRCKKKHKNPEVSLFPSLEFFCCGPLFQIQIAIELPFVGL